MELPAADDHAGLPQYADEVVSAIGNRAPERVILVAQSLGGFTAPLVCHEVPAALLVLVNAMIPAPGETPGEWWANTRHEEAKRQQNLRDDRDDDAPFDPLYEFLHDVPQRSAVSDQGLRIDGEQNQAVVLEQGVDQRHFSRFHAHGNGGATEALAQGVNPGIYRFGGMDQGAEFKLLAACHL